MTFLRLWFVYCVLESLSCLPFPKSQLITSVLESLLFAAVYQTLILESLSCLLFVAVYKFQLFTVWNLKHAVDPHCVQ